MGLFAVHKVARVEFKYDKFIRNINESRALLRDALSLGAYVEDYQDNQPVLTRAELEELTYILQRLDYFIDEGNYYL